MIKVSVIGSGNVAQHLAYAFENAPSTELVQVFARTETRLSMLPDFTRLTHSYDELKDADVYIIAVSDNAIAEVSDRLPFANKLVVHTSGSASMDSLHNKNRKGVFYPLMTFSKQKNVDFTQVPLCLEAVTPKDYAILENTAKAISVKLFSIDGAQRKSLHVSAVFVNNFVNHMYTLGAEICEQHQVPFEILKPLIQETAQKAMQLSPADAQTGPAKRNDSDTINAHLEFLTDENQRTIYKILTKSIQQHVKKL